LGTYLVSMWERNYGVASSPIQFNSVGM